MAAGLLGLLISLLKSRVGFLSSAVRGHPAGGGSQQISSAQLLTGDALKTTPYGLRLVLPSQIFSALGSVQPPELEEEKATISFPILFYSLLP